jgi:serine/threonine-protein kinase
MLLPKKVGNFTLMRRLWSDGITESFAAILDEPAGRQVVARRLLPHVMRDQAQLLEIEQRAHDLMSVRHPVVIPVLDYVEVGEDRYLLEEWVDAVPLGQLLDALRQHSKTLPHNVFLNLATQICNGLEALHSRAGEATGCKHVLHTALSPSRVMIRRSGKVIVGGFGLVRSPTTNPTRGVGDSVITRLEHLSPEQTHPEQKLTPASDIFSLGTVLYEMLTLKTMFRAKSNLQTIHRVRRAEVTSHLLEAKEILPGVDRVLYRALSLNPRHRYQRAFVLREDLRGLMASFSFSNIEAETRAVLEPLFATRGGEASDELPSLPPDPRESTASLLEPVLNAQSLNAPSRQNRGMLTAPPIGIAAPTQRTLIPIDSSAMVDGPEDGAFESEVSTDVRAPGDSTWRTPSLPLEVDDHQPAEQEPPRALESSTTWFPRPIASSGPPSISDAPAPPVSINPIDPESLASSSQSAGLDGKTAFDDEVKTEVNATPAGLHVRSMEHVDEDPSATHASDDEALTIPGAPTPMPAPPVESKRDRRRKRRKKKRKLRRDQASAEARIPEPGSTDDDPDTVVGPPPTPPPAVLTQASSASADDDLDDDLQWRQSNDNGWMIGVGVAAGVLVLSILVCVGLGGTGAVLGSSTTPTATEPIIAAEPAPEPSATPPDADDVAVVAQAVTEQASEPAGRTKPARPEPAPAPRTAPPEAVARPAPAPRPAPAARPVPTPAPRAAPAPVARPSVASIPTSRPTASLPVSPEPLSIAEDNAVATAAAARPAPPSMSDLDQYTDDAYSGRLSTDARDRLNSVSLSDEATYTRANTLLYQDARARSSQGDRAAHLEALFAVPSNRFKPELLIEDAELAIQQKNWRRALDQATRAEQHWARMPSDLMFTRMAMIHEVRAQASLGRFYDSDGAQVDELAAAIRGWQRYRAHVARRERGDLLARADRQLSRLQDMQDRMQ